MVTIRVDEENEKDLGLHVDPSLIFNAHCEQQVNKADRLLGLIRRSYTNTDGEYLVKLFTALVRHHLEYANAVWHTNPSCLRMSKDVRLNQYLNCEKNPIPATEVAEPTIQESARRYDRVFQAHLRYT